MKTHSCFSLKYGILSPEEIVNWAIEAKYPFVFLADINSTGAGLAFLREAKRRGIHGVIGVELRNGMELKCTIIARNNRGFHELNVYLSNYLHNDRSFPAVFPHFGSCYVIYPIDAVPNKLKENEFVEVKISDVNNLAFKYQKIDKNKDFIQKASIVLKEKYPYKLDTCYIYDAPSMFNNISKNVYAESLQEYTIM